MRIIGRRAELPISYSASAALLAEGARFNDDIHRLPSGNTTSIPKGVYRFKNPEDSSRHERDCIVANVARAARDRA